MYEEVISLLHKTNVSYEKFEHEPVLDYETDRVVRERLGLQGAPSKSLFLKSKSGSYYVFFTLEGTRLERNEMKEITGQRLSICSPDELREQTGCIPGCVAPFGYSQNVTIIVDSSVYAYDKILITPGVPEFTIELSTEELKKILSTCQNTVLEYRKTN
ncbi:MULTISPECIES: YbaK/EbsC family protein [Bacillus]|jgi:Ala-tRNA(Pro) deacylase|uniref:DNA-binding protein n=1 Tax=Bacillus pseudomycoides TaxID=64104 RepID=A0AAJ2DJA1_9BACI|nr:MULTISPECIES: YbaK/EbsC family protein [Bacillus]AIK36871.1 aminoacyl-tRNA editing domain protein [Bacillus pseudomycoides]AJI18783.1 aminoacyl-tRNA editing domain protein [Bacillus pseudomycoides]EEM03393.1 YbaK/prolyl-tRNA synthetase associated region [Bacillus pseudomycoides]EEM08973.1 YbaK/prolyl-tRNA synthetase associated region [Bacillus pseudomycoides]EEM14685.1 YbaK/prolyl-tRNA synthetase associated region [Bacillus pseudomycoides DSM 12442]